MAQAGGALELDNLEDGIGARVRIRLPLASVAELEQNNRELRERVARLMPQMMVLPEMAL